MMALEHSHKSDCKSFSRSRQMFTEDFTIAWVTVTLGQVTGKQEGKSLRPAWVLAALPWKSREQHESL